jgi:hypothetical protein
MTQPMDPNDENLSDESEYGWGLGIFPPGVANNDAQRREQGDFGANYGPQGLAANGLGSDDIYAQAVADRRTDPCDPDSQRDFGALGNPDRYGANPPLVREEPQSTQSQGRDREPGLPPLQRKW